MVLRPYQYYAVESIIKKVKENEILNGYNIEKKWLHLAYNWKWKNLNQFQKPVRSYPKFQLSKKWFLW
ncbi:Uncharacterised protein [Elizabethkingia miricola]|nr:Uncharacterised protein [Elizabethkingia miricola]